MNTRPRQRPIRHEPPHQLEPRRLMSHTYYLSPSGSDAAAGTTASTAWQTLAAVNAVALSAGDKVLLQGGATFPGTLKLGADDAGTTAAPITVSSYGTGRATIAAAAADGIDVTDTSGVAITNLDVEGNSPANDTSMGISLFNDRTTGGRLDQGVTIDHCDVGRFGLRGIGLGAASLTMGFAHVRVTHDTLHDDNEAGLYSYAGAYTTNPAPYGFAHADLYVAYTAAYDNAGCAAHGASGDGFELGDVQGATVEHCVAYGNGTGNVSHAGGACGIWTYNSDSVVIQYNESYDNASDYFDGDGFDLDGGCTHDVLQYNYSHDNAGAGYLLCQFGGGQHWGNNTVRYNVTQNDGGKLNYAAIDCWAAGSGNTLNDTEVYGNTIYQLRTGANAPKGIEVDVGTVNLHFRNNIVDQPTGGLAVLVRSAGTGLLFQGNDYYAKTGTAALSWTGTTYGSLAAWRTATGQERVGTTAVGLSTNPQLAAPGGGYTVGWGKNVSGVGAYRLNATSPLIDAGVNLTALGVTVTGTDFYGQPVPTGAGFDIGADERDTVAPTATATVTTTAAKVTVVVRYADNAAISAGSIGTGDLTVTGPKGSTATATLASVSTRTDGASITATYALAAPAGGWAAGTYAVSVPAGQVVDETGNAVAAGVLCTFAAP